MLVRRLSTLNFELSSHLRTLSKQSKEASVTSSSCSFLNMRPLTVCMGLRSPETPKPLKSRNIP